MKYGEIVKSVSGHDEGCFYIAVGEKDGFALLCDGKNKLLSYPKKKNRKHLEKTGIVVNLGVYNPLYDAHIRKELKSFSKRGG